MMFKRLCHRLSVNKNPAKVPAQENETTNEINDRNTVITSGGEGSNEECLEPPALSHRFEPRNILVAKPLNTIGFQMR